MRQQRMTKQKQLVLQIAQSHRDHPTADRLFLEIRSADARISRGTVYRNLEQFSRSGALVKVKLPGAVRFDSRTDSHHHVVCTRCGAVYDLPLGYDRQLDAEISNATDFQVRLHRSIFEGVCPRCQEKEAKQSCTCGQK